MNQLFMEFQKPSNNLGDLDPGSIRCILGSSKAYAQTADVEQLPADTSSYFLNPI